MKDTPTNITLQTERLFDTAFPLYHYTLPILLILLHILTGKEIFYIDIRGWSALTDLHWGVRGGATALSDRTTNLLHLKRVVSRMLLVVCPCIRVRGQEVFSPQLSSNIVPCPPSKPRRSIWPNPYLALQILTGVSVAAELVINTRRIKVMITELRSLQYFGPLFNMFISSSRRWRTPRRTWLTLTQHVRFLPVFHLIWRPRN